MTRSKKLLWLMALWAMAFVPRFAHADIPTAAARYRHTLIGETHQVWGLDGPVAAMGAQVQQESGWNPAAHSSVAAGLTEFTPATATWISGAYPKLGPPQPYNPAWALRALVTYDRDLWQQTQPPQSKVTPATDCDHMAFALSAYNGGIGNVYKDQALTKRFGVTPTYWFAGVALFSTRSAAAFKENRGYPQRILLVLMPEYATWGPGPDCSAAISVPPVINAYHH